MRRVEISGYGGPEILRVAEAPEPEPGPGECLLEVHAVGVNPVDWKIRDGQLRWVLGLDFPYVPGGDLCGRVIRAGPGVEEVGEGDWLFGTVDPRRGGAYAERAVLPVDRAAPKPGALDPAEAVALPIPGVTALEGLREKGGLGPGGEALVIGASGGVGHLAVQVARCLGASATGVCSTRNVAWVEELGAEEVIDYTRRDYAREERDFDVVLDAVAVRSYWACRSLLGRGGTYVTTVPGPAFFPAVPLAPLFGHRARTLIARPRREVLAELGAWAEEGRLVPRVEDELPLEEAAGAHARSEEGRVRGKLVLRAGGT